MFHIYGHIADARKFYLQYFLISAREIAFQTEILLEIRSSLFSYIIENFCKN